MPNIVEYSAPAGELRPNPAGEQAFQLEGRRAGSLGSERAAMIRQQGLDWDRAAKEIGTGLETVGKVVERHQAQQEISGGLSGLAETVDQLNQHYNQTVSDADPFDPNVSETWRRDVLDPTLANFKDQFNTPAGQQWAAEHVAKVATEMYRHTVAADMERAQNHAMLAVTQTTDSLTSMAQRDPSTTDMALGMIPGTINALAKNANLSPELADKMRTTLSEHMQHEVALSGLKGAIENNPEEGLRLAQSGKYDKFISGTDVSQLESYARTMVHVRDIGVKGAAKADEQKLQQVSDARATDYFGQLAAGDLRPQTANDIVQDPQLQPAEKQALVQHIQRQAAASQPATTNPVTMDALVGDLAAGTKLTSSAVLKAHYLSDPDRQWLLGVAQSPERQQVAASLQATLQLGKQSILGPAMAATPAAMAAYGRFQQAVINGARSGAPVDLDKNPDFLRQFSPQPHEIVPPPKTEAGEPATPAKSLSAIFGGP